MKSLSSQKNRFPPKKIPRKPRKTPPNFNFEVRDFYKGICRVFPKFVADHYLYFEELPRTRQLPVRIREYVLQLKKKILCSEAENDV